MALLTWRAPVNYAEQQCTSKLQSVRSAHANSRIAAFEDFLRSYKSSSTEAEDALNGLNIEEDGDSDEYDFMEDAEDGTTTRRPQRSNRQQSRHGKVKYMQMLQDVADRVTSQVVIDLDDLDEVGSAKIMRVERSADVKDTVREGAW